MKKNTPGIDVGSILSLYHRDCLFNSECTLAFVLTEGTKGSQHIKTQCTKCGYMAGGPLPKRMLKTSGTVPPFDQHLYDSVYIEKLKEIFSMSGESPEIKKRLNQLKKAIKQGKYGENLSAHKEE